MVPPSHEIHAAVVTTETAGNVSGLLKTHSFVSMRPAGCGPPPREEIAAFWSSTSSPSAPPVDVKAQDVMVIRLFWHKCQLWWIISLCCYVLCRNLCNVNLYFFVYPAGQKSDFLHSFYLALLHYQVLSGRKSWSPTPLLLF